ncbi:glycosyltransferase [Dehalococcoidia bacterium]|nr:glycosyltransferase [Dehalococcoidia bacterium]
MKIDLITPDFPSWTWNYNYGFKRALDEMGYLNKFINPNLMTDKEITNYLRNAQFDLLICIGGGAYLPRLYDSSTKRALFLDIDRPKVLMLVESMTFTKDDYKTFANVDRLYHEPKQNVRYYSHVFTCDESDVDILKNDFCVDNAYWLPQCVDENMFVRKQIEKRNSLIFIGNINYYSRKKTANALRDNGVYFDIVKAYENKKFIFNRLIDNYLRSKVVQQFFKLAPYSFFYSLTSYNNYVVKRSATKNYVAAINSAYGFLNLPAILKSYSSKVYEAMACGTAVIQPIIKNRPLNMSLFKDGREIILYDVEKLKETQSKIQYYLSDKEKLVEVGENARRKVVAHHTCKHRVEEILKIVSKT